MTLHHLGSLVVSASYAEVGIVLPLMDSNNFRLCSLADLAGLKIMQTMIDRGIGEAMFDDRPIQHKTQFYAFQGILRQPD